jgi:hypothetical protein
MGLLKGAEVAEGPSHLISIPFDISVFFVLRPQHVGYVARHGGLLGNTNYHFLLFNLLGKWMQS